MKGILFGTKHTYDDWDLILTAKSIGLPTPKTSSVEVEGADGVIDTSELLTGEIKFNNRQLQFEFAMTDKYDDFDEKITEISNYLHGTKLKIILDEDDTHYYLGRCVVNQWSSDKRVGRIVVNCDCEPYKYDLRQTVVTAYINGDTYVKVKGKRKTVSPNIVVSNTMYVYVDGKQEELIVKRDGNNVVDLFIHEGVNSIHFSGSGSVQIKFNGGEI